MDAASSNLPVDTRNPLTPQPNLRTAAGEYTFSRPRIIKEFHMPGAPPRKAILLGSPDEYYVEDTWDDHAV